MKTITLAQATPLQLDWLFAIALGFTPKLDPTIGQYLVLLEGAIPWNPTKNWAQAGQALDNANICCKPHKSPSHGVHFSSCQWNNVGTIGSFSSEGQTKLQAMIRCYLRSTMPETVTVPDALDV